MKDSIWIDSIPKQIKVEVTNTALDVQSAGQSPYTILVDKAGNYTYIGEAEPGSSTSAAVWRIKRLDETNDPDIVVKWASTQFDKIWDDRASLSYS